MAKNLKKINEKGKQRIEASRNVKKTGMVNPSIRRSGSNRKTIEEFKSLSKSNNNNSDSEFSDVNSMSDNSTLSVMGDPNLLLTKADEMVDSTLHERKLVNKTKLSQQNQYLEQFQDMKFDTKNGPTSMNAVHNSSSLINRANTERALALKGSYSNYAEPNETGDNMGYGVTNKFNHINMVPNFKTSSYGASNTKTSDISQRKMELFIGKESTRGPKTENKPLFDPIMNATNIFGEIRVS